MHYAERLNDLGTETAFEVLKRIQNFPEKRRNSIISFAIGEPDFTTPDHIKKAGIKAIEEDFSHYSPSAGIPELRKAIADFVSTTKKINISENNVIVLPSAKFVLDLALLSCTNPGD